VAVEIVFETHSITEDNERGTATGWLPGRLSAAGRDAARALGARRRDDGIDALFVSDLWRAVETAQIAFADEAVPLFLDWRLRECDYGDLNGAAGDIVHDRFAHLDVPYPNGESWRQAVARVGRVLPDLLSRWDGRRVLVIGHVATRWGLQHCIDGTPLEQLATEDFAWREGWEYVLGA
jgi:2,3-bisphosphoglycerate-dependent phosphoglycerate mutase